MNTKTLAAAALLATLTATSASALSVTVGAKKNGYFGQLSSGAQDMVQATDLSAGDTVAITATGQIYIGENLQVTANGVDLDSSSGKVFSFEYTPLEQAGVIADPSLANNTLMPNLGALIGAFLPTATATASGFNARSSTSGNGIAATDLFFVGESLTYTAAFDGRLFLGINEGYVSNNSGAFNVSLTAANAPAVPLPAGLPLLIGGLAALGFVRRKSA